MRIIKFRLWNKNAKSFIKTWQDDIGEVNAEITLLNTLTNELSNLDSYVIQQFTGLKDRYGKEIYEGDIIQYNRQSSYDGMDFVVKWSECMWGWVLVSESGEFLVNEYTPEGDRYNFIEIVGNICEKA